MKIDSWTRVQSRYNKGVGFLTCSFLFQRIRYNQKRVEQTAWLKLMKKVFLIIFLFLFLILVIPINANAACPTEGLVPCGTEDCPCQFCHFFVLFDNIVRFVLFNLVPPIAVLMLVIAGVMFFTATGSPEKINEAKKIITSTVLGLLIIFAAWIIINTVFMFIGVAGWTGLREGWFQIDCPITTVCTDGALRCVGNNSEICVSGVWQPNQSCVYGCVNGMCIPAP